METSFPKYLYHYTSQAGLLGIIQTNKVWMTNILYLNDSSEFKHTIDLVKKEWMNRYNLHTEGKARMSSLRWEEMSIDERKYHIYKFLQGDFDIIPQTSSNVFIFSLSMEKNDLSQWRGYCPKGIGFCLEFETEKLLSIIEKKECHLKKCEYLKEEKDKLIKSVFDKLEYLIEVYDEKKPLISDTDLSIMNYKLNDMHMIVLLHLHEIIKISTIIKDESFINEKEYRLVQIGGFDSIKHKEGNSMIVPYIEGALFDQDGKLPISKIIVGPTPHPELSKLSVKSILESKKYEGVEVEISNIPYRSW